MPYIFENAQLLDFSVEKEYLGEAIASIKTKKNLEIEGIFDSRSLNLDAKGVKENINIFQNKLLGLIGQYDSIIINGYNLGQGRILDISFPKNNPILLGEYRYKIEVLENSDFSFLPQNSKYGNVLSTISDKIEDFTESFNFKYTLDGYEYDYDLEIQFYPNNDDLIQKSKFLASSLFNENLNLFFLKNDPNFFSSIQDKDHTFDETYDLIKKKCRFSKNLKINKNFNFAKNYSIIKNYNLIFNTEGGIIAKEEAEISFLKDFSTLNVDTITQEEIASSYLNCQNFIIDYASKYNLGPCEPLKTTPIQTGKEKDIFNRKIKYTVSYVNTPALLSTNKYLNYTSTIETDSFGIKNKSENGEITLIRQLETAEDMDLPFLGLTTFLERKAANEIDGFKIVNHDFSVEINQNKYGNKMNYSINSTTDPSIIKDNILNKKEINILETPYSKDILEYPIPDNPTGKIILSNLVGAPLKSKKIEINAVLKRNLLPTDYFNYFKSLAWISMGSINSSSFISEAEFSYDNLNNISLGVTIQND